MVAGGGFNVTREPLAELIMRVEKTGHDEMEEGPEFCGTESGSAHTGMKSGEQTLLTVHRVLDGCSCEKQSVSAVKPEERLPTGRLGALDGLSLVEDHILPFDALEVLFVRDNLSRVRWISDVMRKTMRAEARSLAGSS